MTNHYRCIEGYVEKTGKIDAFSTRWKGVTGIIFPREKIVTIPVLYTDQIQIWVVLGRVFVFGLVLRVYHATPPLP
jgi:hypothetical protein